VHAQRLPREPGRDPRWDGRERRPSDHSPRDPRIALDLGGVSLMWLSITSGRLAVDSRTSSGDVPPERKVKSLL
jgi:hypothetical protein